jgi:hypothetical protein
MAWSIPSSLTIRKRLPSSETSQDLPLPRGREEAKDSGLVESHHFGRGRGEQYAFPANSAGIFVLALAFGKLYLDSFYRRSAAGWNAISPPGFSSIQ